MAKKTEMPNIKNLRARKTPQYRTGLCLDGFYHPRNKDDQIGFPMGDAHIISGAPGTGKTTLGLQLLDGLYQECFTIFVTNEQSRNALIGDFHSLKLQNGLHEILGDHFHSERLVGAIEAKHDEYAGCSLAVVIDSINNFDCDVRNATRVAWTAFKDLAKRRKALVFVIGHERKDGILAGAQKMTQDCGSRMVMRRYKDELVLTIDKNRYGECGSVGYEINGTGIQFISYEG